MAVIAQRGEHARAAGDVLAGYPVNLETIRQDLPYARRAVVIRQGEDWPAGRFCRNCRARWPCRLARWGWAVLRIVGWTAGDMRRLVERAVAGDVRWT
jgi:hypothetical protein